MARSNKAPCAFPLTHRVPPLLRDVQRHADRAVELELVELNRDYHHDRQLLHEHLWRLADEALVLDVPCGALEVQPRHVASVCHTLSDLRWRDELRHLRVEGRFIERPAVATAGRLRGRGSTTVEAMR